MDSVPRDTHKIAQSFIGTTQPLERLGSGIGGVVYAEPNGRSAIKVYNASCAEGYANEVESYKRLKAARVQKICGFTVPKLIAIRDEYPLIQIGVVKPPFLLDFAGVQFEPPDFSDEVMQNNRERIERLFGKYVSYVDDVQAALLKFGIYYNDFHPGNLKLDGMPDYRPPTEEDLDNEPY